MIRNRLNDLSRELAVQRSDYLQLAAELSPDLQNYRPQINAWSVLEVLEHLLLVDRAFLRQAQANLAKRPRALAWHSGLRLWLTIFLLRLPIRVPVPVATVCPSGQLDFSSLQNNWAQIWVEWHALFEKLNQQHGRQALTRHPISGWFSVSQILQFMFEHHRHHWPQLQRTIAAVSSR